MKKRLARISLGLAAIAACTADTLPPKGQLMLVVTTNLAPPKDFDALRIRVVQEGTAEPAHDFEYTMTGSQAAKLPATLAIVSGSDPTRAVTITVTASRGGVERVKREAIVRVPTSRIATLPLPVDGLCVETACPPAADGKPQTCIAGSCQSAEIDEQDLPDFSREATFGGGTGNGDGTCFDTLDCFANGSVVAKDASAGVCSVAKTGESSFNVAVVQPAKSDGVCASNACLVPLDRDPFRGTVITGWREENGRVLLPRALCDRSLPVMVSTKCPTKSAPTCGAWSAVGGGAGAADASLPIDGAVLEGGLASNVPASVSFTDADPRERFVTGTATIARAPDESGITDYKLYWADGPSKKLDLIATFPKTGADVTHPLNGAMPANATHLIAAATGAAGEIAPVVQTGPIDNFVRVTSINVNAAEIRHPTTLVDATNQRLLIVGFDLAAGAKKPALIRCKLDATACVYVDISAGVAAGTSDWTMSAIIDEKNKKLIAISDRTDPGTNARYFQCDLDGANCISKDLGPAPLAIGTPNRFPLMIDAANEKLVAVNPLSTGVIYRCGLDGEGCTRPTFASNTGSTVATALLSPSDAKLLILRAHAPGNVPLLYRCELDGTSCGMKDISAGDPFSPNGLGAAIDPINQKLLVVGWKTNDPTMHWWRCNLDGTACTTDSLGTVLPAFNTPEYPDVIVDVPHQKVFVFATTQDTTKALYYRCNLDFSGCVATELVGAGGRFPSAFLSNGTFYVVTGRYTTGNDFAILTSY